MILEIKELKELSSGPLDGPAPSCSEWLKTELSDELIIIYGTDESLPETL